jgi:hypothetical protein
VEDAEPGISYCDMHFYVPDNMQILSAWSPKVSQEKIKKQVEDSWAWFRIENARVFPSEGIDINLINFKVGCSSGGEGELTPDVHELRTAPEDGEEPVDYRIINNSRNVSCTKGEHILKVDGDYKRGLDYEFEVEADLEKVPCHCSVNDSDEITGNVAEGIVVAGCDSYGFATGSSNYLVRFAAEDPVDDDGVTVKILDNGNWKVYPDGVSNEVQKHTLTLEVPDGSWVNYEFEAERDLQRSDALNASIDSSETISDNVVKGGVNNVRDSFTYSGDFERFAADGDVRVLLDGAEILPADEVSKHTLTIEETAGNWVNYEFDVSNTVRKSDALNASINDSDEINGSTVSGLVHKGRDSYVYTGRIDTFTWEDSINVYIDGLQYSFSGEGSGIPPEK